MRRLNFLLFAGTALWGSVSGLALTLEARHDGLNVNRRLDCYRTPDCQDLRVKQCSPGYTYVGWAKDSCHETNSGKPICCHDDTVERFGVDANGKKRECIWRGTGPNCNGAGEEGEVVLFKSGNGGGPTESDQSQCSTGYKYFTCPLPGWDQMMAECRWTECQGQCRADEAQVATNNEMYGRCPHPHLARYVKLCCRLGKLKKPLTSCHWVGYDRCDDNTCHPDEVTAARSEVGYGYGCQYQGDFEKEGKADE
ncbi:hypothetical protein CH35J_001567 [Colletotrichum higginsianum]|uniref:Uncharacterized protein n=1 Tax=Colletotrichum higginsianum TaxID=80884 RepID=A0A4T0WIZ0_9PEZI|nr:hypothetical protein CH35J_001567 [Colletotrichum higginsianum]